MKKGRLLLVALVTFAALAVVVDTSVDPGLIRHELLLEYCSQMKQDRIYKKFRLEFDCIMKVSVFQTKVNQPLFYTG